MVSERKKEKPRRSGVNIATYQDFAWTKFKSPVRFGMARTFDVVVLSIHPATDRTLVVAEVRYTPRQDNVELPKAGGSTIAQVKQQKTIVHVWGDYSGRTEDELSKDTAFRKLAVYEAGQLISDFLNERGMLS